MPWVDNSAWDEAIAAEAERADGDIFIGGGEDDEFLYRPRQLVCDRNVWEQPRDEREDGVRGRLIGRGARSLIDNPENDEEAHRGRIAGNLDLHLLDVPRGEELRAVEEARETLPGAVDLVHVMVANPQRHGGCAPPQAFTGTVAAATAGGLGVTIAVLDTGIADPQLPFNLAPDPDVEPAGSPGPATGHGTMVAGVIAQHASDATLVIRSVLTMPLGVADEIDIARALDGLPAVDIVNASFSGGAVDDETMLTFERSVDRIPVNTVIVAAAGNEKRSAPQFMAAFARVIGVASVEPADSGDLQIAHYSNRGPWVKMCARGTDVVTFRSAGERVTCCGTSFAAPQVTAAIAVKAKAENISVVDAATGIRGDPTKPLIPDAGRLL